MKSLRAVVLAGVFGLSVFGSTAQAAASSVEILRDGLLGAGVGAFSAEASGGKAGKGALIGAGVSVIGKALIGLLGWGEPAPQPLYSQPSYVQPVQQTQPVYPYQPVQQPQPVPIQVQPVYSYRTEPVYVQPQPVYYTSRPAVDSNRQILRSGLLGAGVGAISAEVSGGKAGTGALVGAGSNVIGGALLELLTD